MSKVIGISLIFSLQAFAAGTADLGQPAQFLTGLAKVEAATTLDVRTYGAKGNGSTNDTAAIQAAINALPTTGGTVVIPPGTYLVDAVKSIKLRSNTTLQMTPTTVLKVVSNSADWSAVLKMTTISSANIYSGVLMGDRNTHLSSSGEHGMGVSLLGVNGVVVQGTASNNMWGDGYYIGSDSNGRVSSNVQLIDVTADNNRRQGITMSAGNTISIIRPRLTNSNGISYSSGMIIEPNRITDTIQNVSIVDAYTANNQSAGIGINLQRLNGSTVPVSIKISNHVDSGSQRGFSVAGAGIVPGSLVIDNPIWKNNKLNGFVATNHDYRSYDVTLNNAQVINANSTGSTTNSATGSAFSIFNYADGVLMGNVHLNKAVVTDTRSTSRTVNAFYVSDTKGNTIKNTSIISPVINGKVLKVLKTSDTTNVTIQ